MKTLVKEIPFGKAIAKVSVTAWEEKVNLDGWETGSVKLNVNSKVEIVLNGKVVESSYDASVLEYNNMTDRFFEKAKLDPSKKYTKVGDKAITLGEETGNAINAAIEEMKSALEREFQGESEAEKNERKEIGIAKEVVAIAEKEGVENLLSEVDLLAWEKRYNGIYNEGGEGYIPIRVSREEYEKYKDFLASKGII